MGLELRKTKKKVGELTKLIPYQVYLKMPEYENIKNKTEPKK